MCVWRPGTAEQLSAKLVATLKLRFKVFRYQTTLSKQQTEEVRNAVNSGIQTRTRFEDHAELIKQLIYNASCNLVAMNPTSVFVSTPCAGCQDH